jgi:hypothetical protein
MQLKQFFKKVNQSLFSGNILKLFFSYKGVINRTQYTTAIIILLIITKFCVINFISYIATILLLIYCLTALIQKRARSFNSTGAWYIIANIIFLYVSALTFDIDKSFFVKIRWSVYIAMSLAVISHLILILKPLKQDVDEQKRSFLTRFPIIFTILVFSGIFVMFGLKDEYMPDTNRPAFHLGLATGEIYRHTYAYPEFCKAQGYEMVNYPNKVREKFKEEIKIVEDDQMALLSKASDKKYNNIDDFYKSDIWGTQEERFKAPLDFIEALRERMIILEVAKEQNISPDKVKLTKEDSDRVSLKDACQLMDEDPDFFVSSDCPFSYILNYAGKYSNCGTYYNTRSK